MGILPTESRQHVARHALNIWCDFHDRFIGSRDGLVRRIALKGKCIGLVKHDRLLNTGWAER